MKEDIRRWSLIPSTIIFQRLKQEPKIKMADHGKYSKELSAFKYNQ